MRLDQYGVWTIILDGDFKVLSQCRNLLQIEEILADFPQATRFDYLVHGQKYRHSISDSYFNRRYHSPWLPK